MEGVVFYFDWEVALMSYLQAVLPEAVISIFKFITLFGEELMIVAITGFLYWCWDKEYAQYVGTVLVVGLVLNPLLKNIALRRRPYFDNEGIRCLDPVDESADLYDIAAQGYSFPSGHSTNSAAVYGSIYSYRKDRPKLVAAILLPLLVGVSRVVLGNHYPTDVLCGWLSGLVVILLVNFLFRKISNKYVIYLGLFIIGCLGFFYCKSDDYFTSIGIMGGMFLGVFFEEKFVHFESTRQPLRMLLRLVGGISIFLALNVIMKLPFSEELLDAGNFLAHFIRFARYFINLFVVIGVYPLLFSGRKK